MKPNWNRLQELYDQHSQLKDSGKDVVYEIEKEINNLELEALQDVLIPEFANRLALLLERLKCNIEISFQYDGNGKIKYGFGKSGSMAFVQGESCSDIGNNNNFLSESITKFEYGKGTSKENNSYDSDVEKYINIFRNMRTVIKRNVRHPAKAILLITILNGISSRLITSTRRVYLNSSTLAEYNRLWNELVPREWPFTNNICHPYIHLSSDGFYKLDLKQPIPDMGAGWTIQSVKRYVNYAIVDEDFYMLALSQSKRDKIINFLIDEFGLMTNKSTKLQQNSTVIMDVKVDKFVKPDNEQRPSLKNFQIYLSSFKSDTTGRKLSSSSISVYSTALNGAFLKDITRKVCGIDNIFNITDLNTLSRIYESAKYECLKGKGKIGMYAMKLYIGYMNQWKKKNQS